MTHFPLKDKLYNRIKGYLNPLIGPFNRKNLNNTDFTIISNNCWAGIVYEHYYMSKNTPTVGTYFFPDDYLKFIFNLKFYLSEELVMINYTDSKHKVELIRRHEEFAPIGKLGDVEIVFLHYKDPVTAKLKWERRVQRVNWNNIIIKFSYMNGCNDIHVHEFEKIQSIKKFMFVTKEFPQYRDCIVVKGNSNGQIENDTFYYNRYIDLNKLINSSITPYTF